jgi:predicted KAP-like P-loop ATPase
MSTTAATRVGPGKRRACIATHFPTYFQLSLPDDVIPRRDIEEFLARAGDPAWIREALRAAVQEIRRNGSTRVAPLLDALMLHASELPLDKVEPLLAGVFAAADDINVDADQAKGFAIGNNSLRVHWLMRALLFDRTDLELRSKILMAAAKSAALGWLADLGSSAWRDYHPRDGKEREDEAKCLVSKANADRLVASALKAIRRAARDGSLINHPDLASLLYRWRDFAQDDGKAVKRWTAARLKDDGAVVRFASAFTTHAWGQGMGFNGLGDLVAKRSDRAQVSSLHNIMDRDRFRARVEELAERLIPNSPESAIVTRFLAAWEAQDVCPD